ncbi:MAG TPA: FAD synthetase family protein [Candidatus Binatia bacterium]|nr:FAD synthetase family protein [Candidatus Binatia bacterium]
MDVIPGTDALRGDLGRLLFAVGVFDGLHRGHRYLLGRLRRAATRLGARPAVITFDHHPDEILRGQAPPLLCDPEERLVRLARLGVEVTVVEHFDRRLRETPYDVYVERIAERVDLAGFLMTPDAAFGFERRGTPEALRRLAAGAGWTVVVVPAFVVDGQQVRSGEIRSRIEAGDLEAARRLLGRRYAVTGRLELEAREGTALVVPELPVALPPAETYRVRVGSAWRLVDGRTGPAAGLDPPPDRSPIVRVAVAERDGERLRLTVRAGFGGLAQADRVRVVFEGRSPGAMP